MNEQSMTTQEAYAAMFDFLKHVYDRTGSDTLGAVLGSMSTLDDCKPADPAIWSDWEKSVAKAKNGETKTRLELF